jgi:hypothetical protein
MVFITGVGIAPLRVSPWVVRRSEVGVVVGRGARVGVTVWGEVAGVGTTEIEVTGGVVVINVQPASSQPVTSTNSVHSR